MVVCVVMQGESVGCITDCWLKDGEDEEERQVREGTGEGGGGYREE